MGLIGTFMHHHNSNVKHSKQQNKQTGCKPTSSYVTRHIIRTAILMPQIPAYLTKYDVKERRKIFTTASLVDG